MKHFPWDGGAITEIFGPLLGQKTVKATCDRRVPFAHVAFNATEVTCMDCLRRMADEENFKRELKAKYPEHFAHGVANEV